MGILTKPDITSSTIMKHPSPSSHRRAGDWIFSHDIPSDVAIIVGGVAYALHKFPLVSRCGWIRRLVSESKDPNLSKIELDDFPGGAEAFELAAKFCYGINFEIDVRNVASLRCAAEYLDMTEEYAEENLCSRSDTFINDVVLNSLQSCVAVLQACESLVPLAEEIGIVGKCAEAAAVKVCWEQTTPSCLSRSDLSSSGRMDMNGAAGSPGFSSSTLTPMRKSAEWWVEELSLLRIDSFQRVLSAMKARGMRNDSLVVAITHYAHKWLNGLLRKNIIDSRSRTNPKLNDSATSLEHEQRVLVETLVSLLPMEKNATTVSFLCAMLRIAIHLDTTVACRLDLERRIGWQLEQATVDDLLIPSYNSHKAGTFFDLDTVTRIVANFLQQERREEEQEVLALYGYESLGTSPAQSAVMKVARLLDCYLAEVAPDANLGVYKFVAFAEMMPEYSRVVDDGLYRAIDVYLKAHPSVNEQERKKICSLMDCQKLSQEACAHATQNERLPVQVVVQVLYFEQLRLRNAMPGPGNNTDQGEQVFSQRRMPLTPSVDQYALMQRENKQLKMEVAKMKTRLGDSDQEQQSPTNSGAISAAQGYIKGNAEKPKSRFSKFLGKLNPFHRNSSNENALQTPHTPDVRTSRRQRRHSMS